MENSNELVEFMRRPEVRKRIGIIHTQAVRERSMLYGTRRFHTPKEAADMTKDIFRFADREMMVVVSLDAQNAPLAMEVISVGTVNSCLVQAREVFKHAILYNAVSLICFHNHPSGIPEPSKEDIAVTKRLEESGELLGIRLLDHIIIGANDAYVSLMERGDMKNLYQEASIYTTKDNISVRNKA